jgi:hypothetical protein
VSRTQRLSFLAVAVVIAIVAVVLLASSGGDGGEPATTGAQATATPTAGGDATPAPTETAAPTATPEPEPPLLQTGKVTKLRVKQGETVRFRVASPGGDEIHVHGYDIQKEIPAGKVVSVSFRADITGIFEIEFHGTAEQIGQLRVDPA